MEKKEFKETFGEDPEDVLGADFENDLKDGGMGDSDWEDEAPIVDENLLDEDDAALLSEEEPRL